jgi:hypothetical protein
MARRLYIREIIVQVLEDRAAPLHYKAITRELLERGVRFRGRTPENSVISILVRSGDVVSLGSGQYGLRRWGWGAARREQHEP